MSKKEIDRIRVLEEVKSNRMTVKEGSEIVGLRERQMYRIQERYKREGAEGLIHEMRGRTSNRGYSKEKKKAIIKLYREQYSDYGPTLYSEMLLEYHNEKINHETLRLWMREASITTSQRKKRPHRRKREKRTAIGSMIQFDGSTHDWFEGRGKACCLLHAIDDASNRIYLRFAETENSWDSMRTMELYCKRYGIPRSIYMDHGGVFYAEKGLTDFGLAMEKLGIKMIFAKSPQAKGRVERGNRTHQDRLVKALRRENISTIGEANQYLERFYNDIHNRDFANEEDLADVHRPIDGIDLRNVFCYQLERQVKNDYTITLQGTYIQLEKSEEPLPLPRQIVTVQKWLDDTIHIFYKERVIEYTILESKPKPKKRIETKPKENHPWRKWQIGKGKSLNQRA
jgi:hypothetical protein